MIESILANARIVTPQAVVDGSLILDDGLITTIEQRDRRWSKSIDCQGDFILPGLIDLHTDNLEQHFAPRPGVRWPSAISAVLAHDREMLGAGVTTVFDALSLGDYDSAGLRKRMLKISLAGVNEACDGNLLLADHYIHFRCELSDGGLLEALEPHADAARLGLMSLMDHTPGQRQWRDLDLYRSFRSRKNGKTWTDEEFEAYVTGRREGQSAYAAPFRKRVRVIAEARRVPLISHDDTTVEDVAQAHSEGVTMAEFPTTLEAARHARECGMRVIMGAPNVVLGRSHSGNISAEALAAEDLLDILASDYAPASLLQAVFRLATTGMSLPKAASMATATPAGSLGLNDRGRLEVGLRADLLRVRLVGNTPVLIGVWRSGQAITSSPSDAQRVMEEA